MISHNLNFWCIGRRVITRLTALSTRCGFESLVVHFVRVTVTVFLWWLIFPDDLDLQFVKPGIKHRIKANWTNLICLLCYQEAFDYIGSSRMVYDMQQGVFPMSKSDKEDTILSNINLTSIASFIELNQVGYRDNGKLWLHTDPITMKNTSAEVFNDVISHGTRIISSFSYSNNWQTQYFESI